MKKIAPLVLGILLTAASAQAQVARVFVSVNGSDGSTCSNVATPCRTFAGGIAQVDDGGEVIVLDTGSYGGTTITKGVTLNVPPGVVAFAAQPFTIDAPGKDVTLRGLTLRALAPGSGIAVTFTAGNTLTFENCMFNGWNVGIEMIIAGALIVRDSVFKNMYNAIVINSISGNALATVVGCRFDNNRNVALYINENSKAWARDCVFTGNWIAVVARSDRVGIPSAVDIRNCLLANNLYGAIAADSAGGLSVIRVSGCMITGNQTGLYQDGSSKIESYGDNDVRGNTSDTSGTITPIGSTRQ